MPFYWQLEENTDRWELEGETNDWLLEEPVIEDDSPPGYLASAAIAIAGGAAALATSVAIAGSFHNLNEDFVAPPAMGGTIRHERVNVLRWSQGDDIVTAPASVALDEGGWAPVVPQALEPKRTQAEEPDFVAPKFDADYWWRADYQPATIRTLVLIDPEFAPEAAPTPALDEAEWPPTSVKPQASFYVADHQDELPAVLAQDLDYWWRPFYAPQEAAAQPFSAQEDTVPQEAPSMGGTIRHERVNLIRWHQGDELATEAEPASLAHEEAGPELDRSRDLTTFTVWVGDEQIVPQPGSLAQDLDYWWRAFTIPSVVHAQPFRAQEEIVPQPAASLVHEEDGAPLAASGDEATFTVWAEDEQVALSNGGFLEADYWWTAKPVLLDPAAQPITDDPLIVPQPLPLGVDVDPWTPPTVITPVLVLWPTLPWVAEQNEGIEFIAPPAPVVDDRAAKWKRRRDREEVYEEAPNPPEAPEPPKTVKPADPVRKTSKGDLLRAVRALAQQQRELVSALSAQRVAAAASEALAVKEAEVAAKAERAIERQVEDQAAEDDDEEAIAIAVQMLLKD